VLALANRRARNPLFGERASQQLAQDAEQAKTVLPGERRSQRLARDAEQAKPVLQGDWPLRSKRASLLASRRFGLDSVPRLPRNERWRNDNAIDPEALKKALNDVAARSRFVANAELRWAPELLYQGAQCVGVVRDNSQHTRLTDATVSDRHRDRLLVDVESDVLDRRFFGDMLVRSRSLSRVALARGLAASAIYASRLGSALVRRLTPPAGGSPFHIV
jgi:hypothetical protein